MTCEQFQASLLETCEECKYQCLMSALAVGRITRDMVLATQAEAQRSGVSVDAVVEAQLARVEAKTGKKLSPERLASIKQPFNAVKEDA